MLTKNSSETLGGYLNQIIQNIVNPIIVELGVHWSEDTHRLMNLCSTPPRYYGFEPDPRNISTIKERQAQLPYKLNLVEGAVGEHDVVLDFHLSDGRHPNNGNQMTGANSIRPPKEVLKRHAWIDFGKKIKVRCYSLDRYCLLNKIDYIDFMWCDIQGAEYDMILGAREIMAKTKYALLEFSDVELYEGQKTLDEYMELLRKDADWEIVHTYSIDVLLQNKSVLK